MTTDDREFLLATTSWLEAGSDATPPDAVDAVLLAIRTTRQDRVLRSPWRPIPMSAFAKIAIAAAAVLAVALVWINFGPTTNVGSGPTPSPTPSPVPIGFKGSTPGLPLQAGARYTTTDPFPIRMSFVAPAGWAANIGGPYAVWAGPAATGESLSFQLFDKVYPDPCQHSAALNPPPKTAQSLAAAIAAMSGIQTTVEHDVVVGGTSGTRLTLQGPNSVANCTNQMYRLWELPLGATNELNPGMVQRVWIGDIDGRPLVIGTTTNPSDSQHLRDELQAVVDSIEINP
jgi:hypothetical protein